jgi:hypothetical protein
MDIPNIEGIWNLLRPIQTDMELVQFGNAVSGTYQNSEVRGTIEATLTIDGEDFILTGKWSDQLGAGDFRVTVGQVIQPKEVAKVERMRFYGNWKHSKSEAWDGIFEGVKR